MPHVSFLSPAVAGNYQLSAVPPSGRAIRLSNIQVAPGGDTNNSSFGGLVALGPTPAVQVATAFRVTNTAPLVNDFNGDGPELPPGSPLVFTLGGATVVPGHVGYAMLGSNFPTPTVTTWTPASTVGIGGWLAVGNSQWSDNRATLATALDARVNKWANSLLSFDGTAADAVNNRLYRTAEGGVRGDGVAVNFRAFPVLTAGDFTILAKVRRTAGTTGGFIGPSWSPNASFYWDGAANLNYTDDTYPGGAINVSAMTVNQWYTVALRRQAGVMQVRASGGNWITHGVYGGTLGGVNLSNSSFPMISTTQLLDSAFVFRAITDAEWTQFNTYWGT